jgi:hypothetical protein
MTDPVEDHAPITLTRSGKVKLHLNDGAKVVTLRRPRIKALRELIEAQQEIAEATDDAVDEQRARMREVDAEAQPLADRDGTVTQLKVRLNAAEETDDAELVARYKAAHEAGPLSEDEKKTLAGLRREKADLLTEVDLAITEKTNEWWVTAVDKLGDTPVTVEELDAGFGNHRVIGKVIAHLRTDPLALGG